MFAHSIAIRERVHIVVRAAAYLADALDLTTPAAIEAAVRANMVQYNGNVDPVGEPVKMVQLP